MSKIHEANGAIYFNCPYEECGRFIMVLNNEICCKIMRCHPKLSPHASKQECDEMRNKCNWGCCSTIKINNDNTLAEKCDYI